MATSPFRVQILPANNAWALTWGTQIIGVAIGGGFEQKLFTTRAELVGYLSINGLSVDPDGNVSITKEPT